MSVVCYFIFTAQVVNFTKFCHYTYSVYVFFWLQIFVLVFTQFQIITSSCLVLFRDFLLVVVLVLVHEFQFLFSFTIKHILFHPTPTTSITVKIRIQYALLYNTHPHLYREIVGKYQFRYIVRNRSTPHDTNLFTDVNCLLSEFNLFHCNFFTHANENLQNWLHLTSIKSMILVCKQNSRPSCISRLASLSVGITAGPC